MLVANAKGKNGTNLLILGLTEENVTRLRAGKPVLVTSKNHGPAIPDNMEVMIILGKNEEELIHDLKVAGKLDVKTIGYCNHGEPGDPPCEGCKKLGITRGKQ